MKFHAFLLAVGLSLQLAPALSGQSFPFQLFVQDPKSNSNSVANGSSVTVSADAVGLPVTITLQARYVGTGTARTTGPAQIFGSPEFSAGTVRTPAVLNPGDSFSVDIVFNPTATAQATAQILIPYSELDSKGAPLSSGSIALSLVGTAPKFVVTYLFATDQNVISLADGDTLPFPATPVLSSTVVGIAIQNLGSGPGPVTSVKVTGSAFQLQSLPLLPGLVNSASALQFTIKYSPTKAQMDQGTLQVVFPDHTVNVTLTGTGVTSTFTYQLVQNGAPTITITPNQSIDLPSVPVGGTTSFSIVVTNTGNAPGTIPSAAIIGPGFLLTDAPAFPQTLAPNASVTLTFSYTPVQAGPYKAQIRIGTDTFTINSQGLGTALTYTFSTGAVVTTVVPTGLVVFSPVQVSQTSSTIFTIKNNGTAPATIISISIQTLKSAFTLVGLPNLPLVLAPGASASFTILFAPTAAGPNVATLQIDAQSFTLSGSGNPPPPLPAFQFTGPSGPQQPLQQPSVGLTLTSAYSLPIAGTLTITEMPDGFSPDPAVQFASGGQVVAFTIPANTLQAVFPNGATSIKLQTGSVSGAITITPTFSTTGGVDITPGGPASIRFTVPAIAPQLTSAQVTAVAANGFTLQLTGVATSRKLTKLNFTFKAAANVNLAVSQVSVDITSVSAAWFQSALSTPFGGQFAILIPFNLATSVTGGSAAGTIQSVAATIENDLGISNVITAQLQ